MTEINKCLICLTFGSTVTSTENVCFCGAMAQPVYPTIAPCKWDIYIRELTMSATYIDTADLQRQQRQQRHTLQAQYLLQTIQIIKPLSNIKSPSRGNVTMQ